MTSRLSASGSFPPLAIRTSSSSQPSTLQHRETNESGVRNQTPSSASLCARAFLLCCLFSQRFYTTRWCIIWILFLNSQSEQQRGGVSANNPKRTVQGWGRSAAPAGTSRAARRRWGGAATPARPLRAARRRRPCGASAPTWLRTCALSSSPPQLAPLLTGHWK